MSFAFVDGYKVTTLFVLHSRLVPIACASYFSEESGSLLFHFSLNGWKGSYGPVLLVVRAKTSMTTSIGQNDSFGSTTRIWKHFSSFKSLSYNKTQSGQDQAQFLLTRAAVNVSIRDKGKQWQATIVMSLTFTVRSEMEKRKIHSAERLMTGFFSLPLT